MVNMIQIFVSSFILSVLLSNTLVSGNFLSSLFASKRATNVFTPLNDYLVGKTESADLDANVKLARRLLLGQNKESNSFIEQQQQELKKILDSDGLKELASSLAHLTDGHDNPVGRNFQLCQGRNLNRLRNMTEVMNRDIELTRESFETLRLAQLIKQVARAAGDVCFVRLERKWATRRQRAASLPNDSLEHSNYAKIHPGFMLFDNLCQKYQNRRKLEEDDAFLESVEYTLKNTAKLRPDIEESALVFNSKGKRPPSDKLASLMQKALLEPCREMYAVSELTETIKPIADLLVSLVIVDPEDYFDRYIDSLTGEIKEWTRRFVMCEWLLDADSTKLASALSRKGHWNWKL